MSIRKSMFALAALTTVATAALSPTSASAWGSSHGGGFGGNHGGFGGYRGGFGGYRGGFAGYHGGWNRWGYGGWNHWGYRNYWTYCCYGSYGSYRPVYSAPSYAPPSYSVPTYSAPSYAPPPTSIILNQKVNVEGNNNGGLPPMGPGGPPPGS
jgi:hypothetical protein